MGLVALDEVAERCKMEPYTPTLSLRFTLAVLFAFSDGDREPYEEFLRGCTMSNEPAHRETHSKIMRSNAVHRGFNGICRTLGVAQTIQFGQDLSAARREPTPQAKAYSDTTRRNLTKADADRQRFAEAIRIAGTITDQDER